jgi:hypothetical protein
LVQIVLGDLCHTKSNVEIILKVTNPSYCSPDIGPFELKVLKKSNLISTFNFSKEFPLKSGQSMLLLNVDVDLLMTKPNVFYQAIKENGLVQFKGQIPVRISCMLIPFTIKIHVDQKIVDDPIRKSTSPFFDNDSTTTLRSKSAAESFMKQLEKIALDIIRTIGLSHFQMYKDDKEYFALTDVSFDYSAPFLLNIPSLSFGVWFTDNSTVQTNPLLVAGLRGFTLGNGKTYISAFTQLFRNQVMPLQGHLTSFLNGEDLDLHIQGHNQQDSTCFFLQVLDLIPIDIHIPGKVKGQPLILRQSNVTPTLKRLDSITKTCLLELNVHITLHNPLPISINLYHVEMDLLYSNASAPTGIVPPDFLFHVNQNKATIWNGHEDNNITFYMELKTFDICKQMIRFYLNDDLGFVIQKGLIILSVAESGHVKIPFHVDMIRIHPSSTLEFTSSSIYLMEKNPSQNGGRHPHIYVEEENNSVNTQMKE